jgi:type I restriction enzyme, S subunit
MGDLCTITSGKSNAQDAVDDGPYMFFDRSKTPKRSSRYLYDHDALIIPGEGTEFVPRHFVGKFDLHQRAYALFDFDSSIDVRYLYYYLIYFKDWFVREAVGATVKSLRRRHFTDLPVVVAPLAEQKRIVAILNEAFAAFDAATANIENNLAHASDLFESYLNAIFFQKGDGWEETTIGDIADVKGGKRLPKGHKLQKALTPYPYISVSDFTENGSISTSTIGYLTAAAQSEISRYTISTDNLYISIAGTIGKSGIVPPDLDGANLTENACKLVFTRPVEKRFIYYFTRSRFFNDQVRKRTRTTAQPKLALSRIRTISLSLPPLAHQQTLVDKLDRIAGECDQLKLTYRKKLVGLAELKQSLLQKAFSGELTAKEAERQMAVA